MPSTRTRSAPLGADPLCRVRMRRADGARSSGVSEDGAAGEACAGQREETDEEKESPWAQV
jgi:hypothetical protein